MGLLKEGLLKDLEGQQTGTTVALDQLLDALPYNEQGLIAPIAQEALRLRWGRDSAQRRTKRPGVPYKSAKLLLLARQK